jgi:hypothetical protein
MLAVRADTKARPHVRSFPATRARPATAIRQPLNGRALDIDRSREGTRPPRLAVLQGAIRTCRPWWIDFGQKRSERPRAGMRPSASKSCT